MLSEIRALGSEQVQGRREYPIAGGRVLYVPADTSPAWRAVNAMGVLLGAFATYAQAEAAVRENTPAGGARTPPPRTRCSTCRGRHATENCPARPGKKGDEHGSEDRTHRGDHDRGGRARREEAWARPHPAEAGREGVGHEPARPARVGGEAAERGAAQVSTQDVPPSRGEPVISDPHSLDDYYEALASLSGQKAVGVRYVTWKVWGGSRVNSHSDTVELALEELVAQGRADRDLTGKYRARPETELPPLSVNGSQITMRELAVEVPEDLRPRLDDPELAGVAKVVVASVDCSCEEDEEPDPTVARHEVECTVAADEPAPVLSAVNRAAGAVVDALFGVSEYPDAIIAEAQVFAKRAAKALEVARAERERAEAEERGAFEAWNRARDSREAARERVKRLERIAQGVE